jgi:hypothetical protein
MEPDMLHLPGAWMRWIRRYAAAISRECLSGKNVARGVFLGGLEAETVGIGEPFASRQESRPRAAFRR